MAAGLGPVVTTPTRDEAACLKLAVRKVPKSWRPTAACLGRQLRARL